MSESLELLYLNSRLKNKHKNKRCYIIGNGPSLNQQDIAILHDELTIAVNGFWQHSLCKTVNASYWIYADPSIWTKSETYLDPMLQYFNDNQHHINLLLPLKNKQQRDFGDLVKPFYFSYDSSKDISTEIDLTQGIPPYGQNVLSVALMIAMYMGCSEIILIGMDHTWWQWDRSEYEGAKNPLCYSHPEHHKAISDYRSYDWLQNTILVQKYEYYQLLKYSVQNNHNIYNATHNSALDIFSSVKFEDITQNLSNRATQDTSEIININNQISEQEKELYQRGEILNAKGVMNDAINSFFMLLRINPEHSFAYLQLARIYYMQRHNQERGNAYLRNALEISPELKKLSEDIFSDSFNLDTLNYEHWLIFSSVQKLSA